MLTTDKEVKVITELPGVLEERIKMNITYDAELEINAENERRGSMSSIKSSFYSY